MFGRNLPGKFVLISVAAVASQAVAAAEAVVAVATNFVEAAEVLRRDFEGRAAHVVELSSGSTGKLYAQIVNGAPYDAFLAADRERPSLLEESGEALRGSRFVYARGRLALWQREAAPAEADWRTVLVERRFRTLALANPDLAPYGLAARQVLRNLDVWTRRRDRIAMGENVGQVYALVATGNADVGLVALSSLRSPNHESRGRYWILPENLYQPVVQEAVLLRRGADNAAAIAFLDYLTSPPAHTIIESFGYGHD